MDSILGFTQTGWMRSNSVLLGRLSVAIPIAVETAIALKRLKGFYDEAQAHGGVREVLSERVQKLDKRKLAIGLGVGAVTIVGVAIFVQTGGLSAALVIIKDFTLVKQIAGVMKGINIWNLPRPPEMKSTVYPGYLIMAAASYYKAYKELQKEDGSKLKAAMHLTMGTTAFVTPVVMELGWYDVRWHHLSYGLLSTLSGSRSLSMFGTAMALESTGYWFLQNPAKYGYDNIFVDNLVPISLTLAGCTAWQYLTEKPQSKVELQSAV